MEHEQGMDLSGGGGSVATQGVEQAKKLGSTARRRVFSFADAQKENLFGKADGWIDRVAKLAEGAGVPEQSVGRVRDFAGSLKARSTEELIDDVQLQARERPAVFLLGAFALGFLGARLLRDVGAET